MSALQPARPQLGCSTCWKFRVLAVSAASVQAHGHTLCEHFTFRRDTKTPRCPHQAITDRAMQLPMFKAMTTRKQLLLQTKGGSRTKSGHEHLVQAWYRSSRTQLRPSHAGPKGHGREQWVLSPAESSGAAGGAAGLVPMAQAGGSPGCMDRQTDRQTCPCG